jgi:hypothetical protein
VIALVTGCYFNVDPASPSFITGPRRCLYDGNRLPLSDEVGSRNGQLGHADAGNPKAKLKCEGATKEIGRSALGHQCGKEGSRDRREAGRVVPHHRPHAAAQDQGHVTVFRPSLGRVLARPDGGVERSEAGCDRGAAQGAHGQVADGIGVNGTIIAPG